jgi:signal transduction histidine kinase
VLLLGHPIKAAYQYKDININTYVFSIELSNSFKNSTNRLFDRFYRTESSRNRDLGGAGLGLSIVKSIVDLHDWNIKVQYTEENMIIFTIFI